ncbi:MAG: SDR family oxidoreductase [Novosphingobium sp.]|nr:SDR family oxidoreductase [Novosphingobium sp.]MBO9603108.1 SDR family oxidoreductase [Novosphingobium sp.]
MSDTTQGTALVTGASTGIGAVYADRLARRGYDLVLVARDAARLDALARRLRDETGRKVEVLAADLTQGADVARVEARFAEDSALTLLVNNAGMSLKGGTLENSAAEIETIVALNITAVTRLAVAAGKAFGERGKGAIVNIASVLGLAYELSEGVYAGSKAYVINLSRSLAASLRERGVTVQVVLPGATRTEIWERSGKNVDDFPAEMVMSAEDLVDAALAGLDRGEEVTIPPLADETQWQAFDAARAAMLPGLSRREPAARYRAAVAA